MRGIMEMKNVELHFHTDESKPVREGARKRRRADVYRARLCGSCGHRSFQRICLRERRAVGGYLQPFPGRMAAGKGDGRKCRERIPGIFRNGDPLSS